MNFWQQKSLSELSKSEWELLCDGCAKCCLKKLEDFDTGEIFYTSVACDLLNLETCQCTDYQNRNKFVPECIWLTPKDAESLSWLPETCAYRLLAKDQDLPDWHHLISGDKKTVFDAGVAIDSYAITGVGDEQLERFIIEHQKYSNN